MELLFCETETGDVGSAGVPCEIEKLSAGVVPADNACPVHFKLPSGQLKLRFSIQHHMHAGIPVINPCTYYAKGQLCNGTL